MSRGLRNALLAIAGLIALMLVYPLLNESADSSCSAFEKIAVRESIQQEVHSGRLSDRDAPLVSLFGRSLQEASRGSFTAALIKEEHPDLPPFAGCTVEYYDLLFNPSKFYRAEN